MRKNIVVIVLLVVLGIGAFLIINNKRSTTPVQPPVQTSKETPTQAGPVDCKDDQSCLSKNFLLCSPTEFKMPYVGDNSYIITVSGIENNLCRYSSKIVDPSGTVILQSEVTCKVPMELITENVAGHFFGQDGAIGKEKVLAEQLKIVVDYCKSVVQ